MTTIEFTSNFKAKIRDLFVEHSRFVTHSILLFEHFNTSEFKDHQEEVEKIFYKKFSGMLDGIKDTINTFFYDFFFEVEDIEGIPSLAIMKTPFNKEKKLINEQFDKLLEMEYNDELKDSKIFQDKLEDFVRLVTPDNEFSVQIEKKELWLLTRDTKSEGTTESVVIGNDPTDVKIDQDGGFEISDDDGFGYSGVNRAYNTVSSYVRTCLTLI